jgi:hypothetical protein
MRITVDLPQPDGPMIAVNDPFGQDRVTSRSASTTLPRPVKVLHTPESEIPSGVTHQISARSVVSNISRVPVDADFGQRAQVRLDALFGHGDVARGAFHQRLAGRC